MELAPGDQVEIRFFYTPNLNTVQDVRPDGMISLQLVGEVQAAGLTAAALQQRLAELYGKDLAEPDIAVIVRSQWARAVYVGGEVKEPGAVALPAANRLSVVDAIVRAGGYNPTSAELANVLVIRQKEGRRYVASVDLRSSFGRREPEAEGIEPFYVQPMDIVYVPETRIVEVDRWVDQNINRLIPDVGIFVSTTQGSTTYGYSQH
jgi:protein involved in polysaccharide export with SLBB domain